MEQIAHKLYAASMPRDVELMLGADIGGTNSNFGFFQKVGGDLQLLFSYHLKSQEISSFARVVADLLAQLRAEYNIQVKTGCFAGAGVATVQRDYCKPTNLNFAIDAREIMHATDMRCAVVVNDFEVIAHGIDYLREQDLVTVQEGTPRPYANKLIVGAGTGLGKCILVWYNTLGRYVPIASEGGHADFSAQHAQEFALVEHIKQTEQRDCNVSWEDVLSGAGIERIYRYLKTVTPGNHHPTGPHPDEIFQSKNHDDLCYRTFQWYARFYGRCAKNGALDALALSGVYIAGGIAAKNISMFQLPIFINEFLNCGKQQSLLKQVPIYVIADYNVSLYGAAAYLQQEGLCE